LPTFDGGRRRAVERHASKAARRAARVPFGNKIRFALLDHASETSGPRIRLGTYGVIRGAPGFLAGAVRGGGGALEDYGYALERIVLALSVMGLGTCWLAGTYRRGDFADRLGLAADEILPAVTPVGHPAARPSPIDTLLRAGAGSARRRAWEALFSVSRSDAGAWALCLDAVRLAPSAANDQPWRIAKEPGRPVFHLGIAGPAGGRSPRRLDAGIAMCHFALVAAERGLPGQWIRPSHGARNPLLPPGVIHVASWNPA
jgi:nitroreductase